jgi:osmoprotectant transport system substrate-binding protein
MLAAILVLLILGGCVSNVPVVEPLEDEGNGEAVAGKVTVGSKQFTEQLILGQIAILLLEKAGFEVVDRTGLGQTEAVREALENGEIDLYWEYLATAWTVHLGHEEPLASPQECYEKIKEEDLANGIAWLEPASFNNTYAIIMSRENAETAAIVTISDLADLINAGQRPFGKWVFASSYEYALSPEGYPGLKERYGFAFDDVVLITNPAILYEALRDGDVPVAMGLATDGHLASFNLVSLVDDMYFHSFYNCAPVVRQQTLEKYPVIQDILSGASLLLDEETVSRLNALVDLEGKEPREVAREWLQSTGLIEPL